MLKKIINFIISDSEDRRNERLYKQWKFEVIKIEHDIIKTIKNVDTLLNGKYFGPKIFNLQIGLNMDDSLNILKNLSLRYKDNIKFDRYNNIIYANSSIGTIIGSKFLHYYRLDIDLFNIQSSFHKFIDQFKERYNIPYLREQQRYIQYGNMYTGTEKYHTFYDNKRPHIYIGDEDNLIQEDYYISLNYYCINDLIVKQNIKHKQKYNYNFE